MDLELDMQIRLAAFAELARLTQVTGGEITRYQIDSGFEFAGERMRFASPPRGRGIWRPRQLGRDGVPLSILTSPARTGVEPRYLDQLGGQADREDDWFDYHYQDTNPNGSDNVALRRAMELGRPLIYFLGLQPGLYQAMYPVYVIGDDRAAETFRVATDTVTLSEPALMRGGKGEGLKAYATRAVKERLHRFRFRELVLAAYRTRCTVCSLRHAELLDAAHIIPDRDERGHPTVSNGLAMCKIHHSAYDANILGITPAYRVAIRGDVLAEVDGPMLQYGLKAVHGQAIVVPQRLTDRPNPDHLQERYEAFRAA